MTALLHAELYKLRTTRTASGLFAAMIGLVLVAVLLHALSLPADQLVTTSDQMRVFGWGYLGALFAGVAGILSITSEFRYGTVRPTLLVTPRRGRVVVAKTYASLLAGAVFGVATEAVALVAGYHALAGRGLDVALDRADVALLLVGGAAVGALWAVIGLGLGALTGNQVATVVGLAAWLLFVENLLVAYVPDVGRLAPGAAGAGLMGQDRDTLLSPVVGAVLLAGYALAAITAGRSAVTRRDLP